MNTILKKEYKYTKEIYLKLKEDIKKYSKEQTYLKTQRKEDQNLNVPRTIPQETALADIMINKWRLRLMFVLYDLIRDKQERYEEFSNKFNTSDIRYYNKLKEEYLKE